MLKVGELAQRSGLTVRTLHHYDAIGLLAPSGRSESGYRLYSPADVQRLHGIQALRHMGLPLAHIGELLQDVGLDAKRVLAQQLHALDVQIQQATELRGRLALMREYEQPHAIDPHELLAELDGLIDQWFLASLTGPRAATAEQLAAALGDGQGSAATFDGVSAAYLAALAASSPDDMVIVFGSFYTVADVLAASA